MSKQTREPNEDGDPQPGIAPSNEPYWMPVQGMYLPPDVAPAGHEADGTPLYAARGVYRKGLYLGKFRPGFGGANVGYRRREITVLPFEVLVGSPVWAAGSRGSIPAGAIACGHDEKGTPFYLARAFLGDGLHPGRLVPGSSGARIPFGGVEIEAADYEVLVHFVQGGETNEQQASSTEEGCREPLLYWDFENVMSDRGISISVGISSAPKLISGFVSQTGGGPAEVWGETGTVFLTRHLGSHDLFLWFTVTAPVEVEAIVFRHWHNHNPGFPTCPSYQVRLILSVDDEEVGVGEPLTLSEETSGRTDRIRIGPRLAAGSYRLRWRPRGLHGGRDTGSEFFAVRELRLEGRRVEE